MKVHFIAALVFGLLGILPGHAANEELAFEAPEVLLERAKTGRHEYIDVIYQIRNYFFQPRPKEELYAYYEMIDVLEQVEVQLNFPIFEVRPINMLAEKLSFYAAQEISFFEDPNSIVKTFIKYSLDEKKYELIEQQVNRIQKSQYSRSQLIAALQFTRLFLDSENPSEPYQLFLKDKTKDLEGIILKRLMKLSKFSDTDLYALLSDIRGLYSVNTLIGHLTDALTDGNTNVFTENAINIILLVGAKAALFDPHNDELSLNSLSSFSSKFFMEYLSDPNESDSAISIVEFIRDTEYHEIFSFFQYFNFQEIVPSKTDFAIKVLKRIVAFYKEYSPIRYEFANHKLNVLKIKELPRSIEGQYEVEIGRTKGLLTIYKTHDFGMSFILLTENGRLLGQGSFPFMDGEALIISTEDPYINGRITLRKFLRVEMQDDQLYARFSNGQTKLSMNGKRIQSFDLNEEQLQSYGPLVSKWFDVKSEEGINYSINVIETGSTGFRLELVRNLVNSAISIPVGLPYSYSNGITHSFFSETNDGLAQSLNMLTFYRTTEGRFVRYFAAHLKESKIFKLD